MRRCPFGAGGVFETRSGGRGGRMFDISWSEILVVGIVALLVVGPKELPALLRTIGRYFGVIKRQAVDFRAQFDEALREAELDQVKKEMESLKTQAEATLQDTQRTISDEFGRAQSELDSAVATTEADGGQTPPVAAEVANGTKSPNGAAAP